MAAAAAALALNKTANSVLYPPHPYYPLDALVNGYVENKDGVPYLLTLFFGACAILFTATYFVGQSVTPKLNRVELFSTMWFVLSGAIHLIFEGYYALNFADMGEKQTILGQLWKEYAFSDSRYLTQNAFVLCMESVTAAFWGPGCLIVAYMIVVRHPMRYPLQMLVSGGQFYGDVLYYATCGFDHFVWGKTYARPEPFYFWFYFFFMNFIWIVIPGYLIIEGSIVSARAIDKAQRQEKGKKVQ
nr:hypothetical protein B0A51_05644 [Rachicladosporium sp. CCFEE 5018]